MDIAKQNRISNLGEVSTLKQPKNTKGILKIVTVLVSVVVVITGLIIFRDKIKGFFNPISIIANVTAADLKETDGRTNVLIMGSDQRKIGAETNRSVLTDTLLVASIGRVDNDVVLISLPRDLWVNQYHSKINAVYAQSSAEGLKEVVEEVLGMPIHYHVMITFDLFTEAIDTLGGVEVDVENSFTDYYYPIEGKENAPYEERYETVEFEAGPQTMDGETALKYVRSRKGNNDEDTDFARSKRQQKVIMAVKNKALSLQTLINPAKLKELYDIYANNVDTDIDFGTVQSFYILSQQLDLDRVVSVVLDDRSEANNGGLLYAPQDTTLYSNQYVLIPQTGDFSQIHAYVQRYLFGNK